MRLLPFVSLFLLLTLLLLLLLQLLLHSTTEIELSAADYCVRPFGHGDCLVPAIIPELGERRAVRNLVACNCIRAGGE